MANLNRVLVIGRLTRDPELRYTPGGTAVTTLGIATNRKYKEKEETLFLDVTVWAKQAEACCAHLAKGREVFIEGYLQLQQWEQDGNKRSKMVAVADRVLFLGGPRGQSAEAAAEPAETAVTEENPF